MEIVALVIAGVAAIGAAAAGAFAFGEMRGANRAAAAAEHSAEHARRSTDAAQEALTYQRAEWERERRARMVPPTALLDLLLGLHKDLNDILTAQGVESTWFLEPHRQDASMRLAALAGQIVDDRLNELVGRTRDRYLSCWSHAPGHNMLRGNPKRAQQQVDLAEEGVAFVKQAIDRYNYLVRDAANPQDGGSQEA